MRLLLLNEPRLRSEPPPDCSARSEDSPCQPRRQTATVGSGECLCSSTSERKGERSSLQPRSLSQLKIAANIGSTSARNSPLASCERSGPLLSAHQFSTRMNVEATYWTRTAGGT